MPVLLKGSRYAERTPIGQPDIIRNVKHDRLRQFYADWYRPDLMAVIAVGDFDPSAIVAAITAHFASIPSPTSPRPRPVYPVPSHPGTLYAVATDKEATATTVGVFSKAPARDQRTVGTYRQTVAERLFSGMLSERLDEVAHRADAPFLAARTSRGLFLRSTEATTVDALVTDGGAERGLAALFAEAERVARDGFTADGTRSSEAEPPAPTRAGAHREGQEPVRAARRRVRPQLHPGRTHPRHRLRARVAAALPPGDRPRRGQRPGQELDARREPGRGGASAREGGARRAHRGVTRGGDRARRRPDIEPLRRHRQHAAAARSPADAGRPSSRHRPGRRSASPNGSCPTACASCSSPRRSRKTRSCSGPSARAGPRLPVTATSSPPPPPTTWWPRWPRHVQPTGPEQEAGGRQHVGQPPGSATTTKDFAAARRGRIWRRCSR